MKETLGASVSPRALEAPAVPPSPRAPLELVVVRDEDTLGGGESGTTRRTMMTRGLLLVAGAIGVGVAGTKTVDRATGTTPAEGSTTFKILSPGVRFHAPGSKAGSLPAAGEIRVPFGTLVGPQGRSVGDFSTALMPSSGGQIAVQRFVFDDGTLIGMGPGDLDGSEYAITGGTGRFDGASGSYVAHRQPGGAAEFDFRLRLKG
jgi:hypothetical protein